MRKVVGLIFVGAAALAASCGDVVRQGRAPVYLIVDDLSASAGRGSAQFGSILYSDVITNVTSPDPCSPQSPCPTVFSDVGRVILRLAAKDVTSTTAPTSNNDVTISRFHVSYKRADGRGVPGVDVPYAFDGATTSTLCGCGTAGQIGFEMVRHAAKEEAPLIQLITSPTIIGTIAEVTFYGRDQTDNDMSVTGSMQVNFGILGDF